MSNDAAGFASATDRSVAPPNGAFDAGLRPGPFPDRAASLLPGLLAATRTGLPPAGDDELTLDQVTSSTTPHHWAHSEDLCRHERKRVSCPPQAGPTAGSSRGPPGVSPAGSGASPEGERSETLRLAAGGARGAARGRELSSELVDDAVNRARVRSAVGELPGGGRLSDELLDELLAGAGTAGEIVGPGGLLAQLTKRLVERALEVELTEHLGYEPHAEPVGGGGNTRNGTTAKPLQTEHGPVAIETPRDRNGSFEPQIVRKRQRRFAGFDDKIPALYARGL